MYSLASLCPAPEYQTAMVNASGMHQHLICLFSSAVLVAMAGCTTTTINGTWSDWEIRCLGLSCLYPEFTPASQWPPAAAWRLSWYILARTHRRIVSVFCR